MTRGLSMPCLIMLTSLIVASSAVAQPTNNMLGRVMMVESQFERGTIFWLDVDQREYWITAKHVLTGAKKPPFGVVATKSTTLKILNPGVQTDQWLPEDFSVIDPGDDIDIVALAPTEALVKRLVPSVIANSDGIMMGGACEFLGFPYGRGWRANYANGETSMMPFVKHCTVSALIRDPTRIWILDGINNLGFSGGPVFFGTGEQLKIFGVVSGYRSESIDVIPSDPTVQPNAKIDVNSGFFVAYDISYAIEAIHQNPIGPLRETK